MKCKECGKEKFIANKHFGLCFECNNIRIREKQNIKKKSIKSKKRKSLFCKPIKDDGVQMIDEDEKFYERCFKMSNNECEECGEPLPTMFRDIDGKILARYRYSHIVPKSIADELRHDINNINHLCLKCHMKWENGNRSSMKIYKKNKEKFPQFFE